MITKAGIALLATAAAAAAGAPSASAEQTCVTASDLHVGAVCVVYDTNPTVRVYGWVFSYEFECDHTLYCDHTLT